MENEGKVETEGQEGKAEPQNPAHKLLKRLAKNPYSLHISQVHPDTKAAFIAFADEGFFGDWGMALKWLMDDLPGRNLKAIALVVDDHEQRIASLESVMQAKGDEQPKEEADKYVKMCDGKNKKVRK